MLQELTPLGLKGELVLQPHEDKVPEWEEVMRECLPLFTALCRCIVRGWAEELGDQILEM